MDLGRAAMTPGAAASGQPQSQAITSALGAARWTACSMVVLTSARISAVDRSLHRGQASLWPCEAQLVRFSDAVMVKTPARSGTAVKTWASESPSHLRTTGDDVQRVANEPSVTPSRSRRSGLSKNAI